MLELVELGTLQDYLAKNTVPWSTKISFALDTATGMAYVHSMQRMHRDLKSGNLLVSASLTIKVADFGTATLVAQWVAPVSQGLSQSGLAIGNTDTSRGNENGLYGDLMRTNGFFGTILWVYMHFIRCTFDLIIWCPSRSLLSFV